MSIVVSFVIGWIIGQGLQIAAMSHEWDRMKRYTTLWIERAAREGDDLILFSEAQMPMCRVSLQHLKYKMPEVMSIPEGVSESVRRWVRIPEPLVQH